ncbi:MAG: hypothetical protein SOY94_10735 [Candidatus Limiplasma sp.]|nr:hypothetical protein [Candidatus Limiplasma sp.]
MKKIILSVAACLVLLSGCGSTPKTVEIDNVAVYEDYMATLTDAEYFTADDGGQMIRVYVEYTNNGADGLYILESFIVTILRERLWSLTKARISGRRF